MEDTHEIGKIVPLRKRPTPSPTFVVSDDWEPANNPPLGAIKPLGESKRKSHGPKGTAESILDFVRNAPSHPAGETYKHRKELVSDYTIEQVEDFLRKSTESDWATRPAFYKALAERRLSVVRRKQTTREWLKSQGAIVDDSTKFDDD